MAVEDKPISLLPTVADILATDLFTTVRESDPKGTKNKKNVATQVSDFVGSATNVLLDTTTQTPVGGLNEIIDRLQVGSAHPTGFPNLTDSEILYDPGTREITVQPKAPATTFDYYLTSIKHTVSAPQSLTHPDTTGTYFFYWDSTNTLRFTLAAWDIMTDVPISYVIYNSSLTDGFANEERHSSTRNPDAHLEFHSQIGTYIVDGFGISGYAVQPGSPTDANNTFALELGNIADEDLISPLPELADDGPYTIFYRSGATGEWLWDKTATVPYFSGATYIQYNEWTGSTWQLTEQATNDYMNMWVFKVPALDGDFQTVIVVGQDTHSTLAGAVAESVQSIQWGDIPFQEIAGMWQIPFRTNAGYSSTGKCRIEAEPIQIIGSRAIITGGSQSDHNALSGLQAADDGVTWGHITDQSQAIYGNKDFRVEDSVTDDVTDILDLSHYLPGVTPGENGIGVGFAFSATESVAGQSELFRINAIFDAVTSGAEVSHADFYISNSGAMENQFSISNDGISSSKVTVGDTLYREAGILKSTGSFGIETAGNLFANGDSFAVNTAGEQLFARSDSNPGGVTTVAKFRHFALGTVVDGVGTAIEFNTNNDNSQHVSPLVIEAVMDDVSDGSEDSSVNFNILSGGATVTPININANGISSSLSVFQIIGATGLLLDSPTMLLNSTGTHNITTTNADTAAKTTIAKFSHVLSSGTALDGIGASLILNATNDAATQKDMLTIESSLTDVSNGAENSKVDLVLLSAGGAVTALTLDAASLEIPGRFIYSRDSVQTLVAATTIPADNSIVPISSASDVILTSNPQIAAGSDGQEITIVGTNATYTQRLVEGNGLKLDNGQYFTLGENDSITLFYYNSLWIEKSRVATT